MHFAMLYYGHIIRPKEREKALVLRGNLGILFTTHLGSKLRYEAKWMDLMDNVRTVVAGLS